LFYSSWTVTIIGKKWRVLRNSNLRLYHTCRLIYALMYSQVLLFSARCNTYISRLCYDVSVRLSVRLSVTEVHWRIIANLGFKFRSKFTAHCGHSPQCARMHCESQCMRARSACRRIVVAVHAVKRGGSSRAMLATARPSCTTTWSLLKAFLICNMALTIRLTSC